MAVASTPELIEQLKRINTTPCNHPEAAQAISEIREIIIKIIEGCCDPTPDCDNSPLKACCNYLGLYMGDRINVFEANGAFVGVIYYWVNWTTCTLEINDIVKVDTDPNCIAIITPDPCVQACRHECSSSGGSSSGSGSGSGSSSGSSSGGSSSGGSSSGGGSSSSGSGSGSSSGSESSSSGFSPLCCIELTDMQEEETCYIHSGDNCAELSLDNYDIWCPGQTRTFTLHVTGPLDCNPGMSIKTIPNTPAGPCPFEYVSSSPAGGQVTPGPGKTVGVFWEDPPIASPATFTLTVRWKPGCFEGLLCPKTRFVAARANYIPSALELFYQWEPVWA